MMETEGKYSLQEIDDHLDMIALKQECLRYRWWPGKSASKLRTGMLITAMVLYVIGIAISVTAIAISSNWIVILLCTVLSIYCLIQFCRVAIAVLLLVAASHINKKAEQL